MKTAQEILTEELAKCTTEIPRINDFILLCMKKYGEQFIDGIEIDAKTGLVIPKRNKI